MQSQVISSVEAAAEDLVSRRLISLACPIPVIPIAMVLNMMKTEKYKILEYFETPTVLTHGDSKEGGIAREGSNDSSSKLRGKLHTDMISFISKHQHINLGFQFFPSSNQLKHHKELVFTDGDMEGSEWKTKEKKVGQAHPVSTLASCLPISTLSDKFLLENRKTPSIWKSKKQIELSVSRVFSVNTPASASLAGSTPALAYELLDVLVPVPVPDPDPDPVPEKKLLLWDSSSFLVKKSTQFMVGFRTCESERRRRSSCQQTDHEE
ncbi:hypothetical protein LXL04_033909 [Taraxacum kok-saghyz]